MPHGEYLTKNYTQSELFELTRQAAVDGMYGAAISLETWCPGCLLYIFNAYDDQFNINEYRYQLSPANKSSVTGKGLLSNFGHCEDSFTIPPRAWNRLIRSPPAPLVEIYYQCTKALSALIFDSFGIASSNACTIGLPFLSALVVIIFTVITATKIINIPKEVEEKLVGKRQIKKEHIENKLIEVDPEFKEALEAYQIAKRELHELEAEYKELKEMQTI